MIEKYLQPFASEMRGYCETIGSRASVLRDTHAAAQDIGTAAQELTRLFHSIAGTSSSLEIEDIAALAAGLETCLLSVAANAGPAQHAGIASGLADLLDLAVAYLTHRIAAMEAGGQFTLPTPEDEEPLHILEERLLHLGRQLDPPDEGALLPAESLSAQDLEILRAFRESDLAEAAQAPRAALPSEMAGGAETSKARQSDDNSIQAPAPDQPAAASAESAHLDDADVAIPPEMLQLFQAETQEDLAALQSALARLETSEEQAAAVLEMRHLAHKIKGAAATLNLQVLAGLSHCLEDILDLLRSRRLGDDSAALDALMHGLIELEGALHRLPTPEAENAEGLERLRAEYDALLALMTPESTEDPAATQPDSRRLATAAHQQIAAAQTEAPGFDQSGVFLDLQRERGGWAVGREHSLRVEVDRLDRLMGLVSDLAANRANTGHVRQEINNALAEMGHVVQQMNQLLGQLDEEIAERSQQERQRAQSPALAQSQPFQKPFSRGQREEQSETAIPQREGTPSHPPGTLPLTQGQKDAREALGLEQFDSEEGHLLRALREGVSDISTISDSLHGLLVQMNGLAETQEILTSTMQRDITNLRLIPLAQILPRLQLTVRMIAQEHNKQINFQASGESTEIDRDIIEAITGPLIQLVRNCAAHGIESAEDRREQGKPEVGTISLRAYYSGNEVSIEVSDDGSGINHHRLIASALASGALTPEEAERLDPEEAINLMLLPGISTSPEVTTIAGRGVGMDIVRSIVEELRGTLHIHSRPGQGTTFHLRLPISLGILRALFVRSGHQHYAVPLSSVERIAQQDQEEALENTALFTLTGLLGITSYTASFQSEEIEAPTNEAALIVPLGQQKIGVIVDEVLAEREIVVRRLPPHLRRRGVRGVTFSPTGQMLLLLDLPELAHRALSGTPAAQPAAASGPQPTLPLPDAKEPTVLIVDDSLFLRRTLELQLSRAGYRVKSAEDGMDALHQIMKERPSLVLLDIEMPHLNGYELLEILRGQPQLKEIPVAMLTSRAAEKHRYHAMTLGANAYLVKPCPHDVLLQTVAGLAGRA